MVAPVTSGWRFALVDCSGKPTTVGPPLTTSWGRSAEDENSLADVHGADEASVLPPVTSRGRFASVVCSGNPTTDGPPLTTNWGRSGGPTMLGATQLASSPMAPPLCLVALRHQGTDFCCASAAVAPPNPP